MTRDTLQVTCRRLSADACLVDGRPSFLLERDGCGVVGYGVARSIVVPGGAGQVAAGAAAAAQLFGSVVASGPGEVRPVVVGAFGFEPSRSARLHVPRTTVVRSADGCSWILQVPGAADDVRDRSACPAQWDRVALRAEPAERAYESAVAEAVRMIAAGRLHKVVLSRTVLATGARPLDPIEVIGRLRRADPGATTFLCEAHDGGVLVGATPEVLVSRRGRHVLANPLAGTAPRFTDSVRDAESRAALSQSQKDRREHEFVVEAVTQKLRPYCDELTATRPEVVGTAAVWHLSTQVRGVLRDPAPTALDLAAVLHPTPAVCGTPTDAALHAIRKLEGFDRGGYTGIVGWVDAAGDGDWAVALRCAELHGSTARLYAGAGIVAGSDPASELAETGAKLQTMLRALGG